MASYPNHLARPNPFYVNYPMVYVVRHVRRSPAGELISEDPNTLHRYMQRIINYKMHPQTVALVAPTVPAVRNVPQSNSKKGPW